MKNATLVLFIVLHAAIANAQWTQTNGPVGGGARDIIRLSGHLFVNGSNGSDGGIFRSDDNGETWTAVNNGLPSHACYSLASNGENLFAAIYGSGIYRSIDLGATWTLLGAGDKTFYSILAAGHDIYGALADGGIYYSGDDGANWTMRTSLSPGEQVRNFIFLQNTLFVVTPYGVYKSSNKGESLTKLNVNGNANFLAGSGNNLYTDVSISNNLGEIWSQATLPGTDLTSAYADGNNVAVAAYFKFFLSGNGGGNWTTYDDPGYTGRIFSVYKEGDKVFAAGNDGVFISPNSGAAWEPKNNGLRNVIVDHLASSSTNLFAGSITGIFTSPDKGDSWSKINDGLVDNTGSNYIIGVEIKGIYPGPAGVFTATTRGVYKLADNGQAWTSVLNVPDNALQSLAGDGGKMFVHAGDNQYYSNEDGTRWTMKSESSIVGGYAHSVVKGDTIVTFGPGGVYLSKDFGESWNAIPIMSDYYLPKSALIIDDILMMATYPSVYVYSFASNTWIKRSHGLPTDEVLSLTRSGTTVYAGTPTGVYASHDAGVSWYPTGNSNKAYYALIPNDTYLFGATYGESVWKSKLSDLNITPVISAYAGTLESESGKSFTISLANLTIIDPDTDPNNIVLTIHPSTNYTVSGTTVTPVANFAGNLDVTVSVSDGHTNSIDFVIHIGVIAGLEDGTAVTKIYPNPVSQKLYIRSPRIREYKIRDMTGREILHGAFRGESMEAEVDVSMIASGPYFIEVFGDDKSVRKFVKVVD